MATTMTIGHTLPIGGIPTICKDNENFFRLIFLLIETGRKSLQYIFQTRYRGTLDYFLKQNEQKLKNLYYGKQKIINTTQWNLMFPTARIAEWDISLLCILLTNVCCLCPPKKGWGEKPDITDQSISADIVRLRFYRNEWQGHVPKAAFTDADFNILWKDIETVILRLSNNTLKKDVDSIANVSFERNLCQNLLEGTKQWVQQESLIYLDNIRELSTNNGEEIKQVQKTLSKFEQNVTKQLMKVQNNNCTMEKMTEKVTNICNETLGSIVKIISSKDEKQEEVLCYLRNITFNLDTVQSSLEMQKEITILQRKAVKTLEDQGDILRLNHGLAKSGNTKLDFVIDCVQSLCCGGCHGDLSEDEESKDHTFDKESSKYRRSQQTRKADNGCNALRKYCDTLVENGESNLFCLKCNKQWEYTQIRDIAGWSEVDREAIERKLNQNFINKDKDIKHCPLCKRFCIRKNPRDVRIVCLFCSFEDKRFEFCWQCLKEWKSYGISVCGNIGCVRQDWVNLNAFIDKQLLRGY